MHLHDLHRITELVINLCRTVAWMDVVNVILIHNLQQQLCKKMQNRFLLGRES